MVKKLRILLGSLLVVSASHASDMYSSNSLVGFEAGYSKQDIKYAAPAKSEEFGSGGMKIGAETDNFRMFLSARMLENKVDVDFQSAYLYGLEFQYMFNLKESVNFFIGVNYGRMSLEFDDLDSKRREYTTDYMGGDVGFNFHLGESFDLELGSRLVTLDKPEHTLGGKTYTFDDVITYYIGLIYKYKID